LFLLVIVAGCQGDGGPQRTPLPTPIPATLTPRSTPLPPVGDAPRLGEGPRQIELVMATFGDSVPRDARDTGNDLQSELEDELELDMRVTFADETDALEALCSGAPRAAWVSAYSYVKAQQECGAVPVLAVQRGRTPRIVIGETAEIVSRAVLSDLEQLRGLTFCRSADQDYFTGWVYPQLLLTSSGLNLGTDVALGEYPRLIDMGRALYITNCNAIALPPGEFEDFLDELADELDSDANPITTETLNDVIHVLQPAGTIVFNDDDMRGTGENAYYVFDQGVIPYEVLVFAPDSAIPEQLRKDITEVIQNFLADRVEGNDRLENLLDATGIMPVTENSYVAFSAMLVGSGWDMTAAD
jgi:hypothetical protein